MKEISTIHMSENNDYVGNDGSLDEKKVEDKLSAVKEVIKDMTAIELWQKILKSDIGSANDDILCERLMDTILGFKETFAARVWDDEECYSEVMDDYVDENAKVQYIDAWKTDDDEEEGISACVVINGIPYYRNCEAMTSPKVAEAVARYEIK